MNSTSKTPLERNHTVSVQNTCLDSSTCKLSAVEKGYIDDPFLKYFVKKRDRKMPIINRGYFSRVVAIEKLIQQFLEKEPGQKKQIVVLGAGHDTTYFKLKRRGLLISSLSHYYEIDFPEINQKKIDIYLKTNELREYLGYSSEGGFQKDIDPNTTSIYSKEYSLLSCDLRDGEKMDRMLQDAGINFTLPTLAISECVFIYMEPKDSLSVIQYFSRQFQDISMILYEQILPDDNFGKTMIHNLKLRGCDLLSITTYPDLSSQNKRFYENGYPFVSSWDMNDIYYKYISLNDRQRIEKLEFLDEVEEYHLIQRHYCLVIASNSPTYQLNFT